MPLFSTVSIGVAHDRVVVEELVGFLGDQRRMRVGDRHAPLLALLAERLAEDIAEIDHAKSAHCGMPGISNDGMPPASFISSSTSLSSSSPARRDLRKLSRVLPLEAPTSASSRAFLGARFGLRLDIAALGRCAPGAMPTSRRSRTICSTSRPT